LQEIIDQVREGIKEGIVLEKEPMEAHTSFRIGGPADLFVRPANREEIRWLVDFAREKDLPFFVVGNGSNLLVSDEGFRGMIIHLGGDYKNVQTDGLTVKAEAGASLAMAARAALDHNLTGLEFAAGIPGSVGGAVSMNAGAYGGEIKDVLLWAEVLTPEGDFIRMTPEELDLSYRHSIVFERGYIVLSACFCLKEGRREDILSGMEDLAQRRKSKQPLEFPSAGSTFKRPEGYFAGKLIQDAGLKGYTVGGAQVSEKHSGFVINRGGAEACEVAFLIRQVRKKVAARFGVLLEPEVRFLGFDPVDPADDVR
jgi:UDP-N-acetylmuramate dehydrogenase